MSDVAPMDSLPFVGASAGIEDGILRPRAPGGCEGAEAARQYHLMGEGRQDQSDWDSEPTTDRTLANPITRIFAIIPHEQAGDEDHQT